MPEEKLDHRAVIMALTPNDREQLIGRADLPGLVRFAVHFGVIVILAALILAKIPYWPLLMLPLGVVMIFLFTALHEAIHETAFRTRLLNRIIANICGFLVVVPPVWFRYFHFAHHGHTHDPIKDPELLSAKPGTFRQYVAHLTGIPYWIGMAKTIAANVKGAKSRSVCGGEGTGKSCRRSANFRGTIWRAVSRIRDSGVRGAAVDLGHSNVAWTAIPSGLFTGGTCALPPCR